ncbi:ubiquinone-dependent pyruvate dehydrogenase, partial [Thioclava sp. BHET1]
PEVVALAQKLKAPVVHTSRAKEFIEPNNPCNIGMTGILGNRAGMEAIGKADLMLCLGTDFAWTQFYPSKAKVVQIDADPTHLGRRAPVHLGLAGDVGATIAALLPAVQEKSDDGHLTAALKQWEKDQKIYDEAEESKDAKLIHPQTVAGLLDDLSAPDAIYTADGGSPMVWALRHLRATGDRRFLISLLHGTMANAYPQAMGIAASHPERQVIALSGDGGMTMLMGDLLTLKQEKLPVKLLVFNNGSLGFVEMEQRVEGLLDAFTELENPDFAALAQVCGLSGRRVETLDQLEPAMKGWLAEPGPALLDVRVSRMELVMPPKIEAGQVASTALFGAKAMLSGRSSEVVSLLRDNFLR